MKLVRLCLLLISFVNYSIGARILCAFSLPSNSHQVVFRAYAKELAKRGHELVVITPNPMHSKENIYENVTVVDVHDVSYSYKEKYNFADMPNQVADRQMFEVLLTATAEISDVQLATPQVKALIDKKMGKFDLVVVETLTPLFTVFSHLYGVPLIGITSMMSTVEHFEHMGNPTHPLLYSNAFGIQFDNEDIWERIDNIYTDLVYRYIGWSQGFQLNKLAQKHFGKQIPSIDEMQTRYELTFMNTNQLLTGIRPLVPGIIYLGSLHIEPTKPLPKDLQTFLDESYQGVIYFSLGSNVYSKDLRPETLSTLLNAFRALPYNVLWKWENDTMPNKPENVYTSKWVPQQDLLAHPNIRAFITQGGQQSTEEAIHHGVPIVGIPFIYDQYLNIRKAVSWGIAQKLDFNTLTQDVLKKTIVEVAENRSYRDNARRLGQLFRDEPMSPHERAVWWTEYVLRHGGAQHLRAPAADVPWWRYYALDVLACLLAAASITLLVFIAIVRLLMSLVFQSQRSKKVKVR